MKTQSSTRVLAQATLTPDLQALRTDLQTVLGQADGIRRRQNASLNLRHNHWAGQSDDYRRHEDSNGRKAAPFEGAPDERVPVIDTLISERAALFCTAILDSDIQAVPVGTDQLGDASKVTRLLRWLRQNVLQGELLDESEILANFIEGDDPGTALLKVWWKREPALELRELKVEDVARLLLNAMGVELDQNNEAPPEAQAAMIEVADLLTNKERETDAMAWLQQPGLFPMVETKTLLRALRELRKTGATQLPVPYVKENRPCVSAKRYMQDVFYRSEYDDVSGARVVHEREFLTETELRTRVLGDQYDQSWVDLVLDAGPGPAEYDSFGRSLLTGVVPPSVATGVEDEARELYEVWTSYSKASDSYGIAGVYWTVFSLKVQNAFGYHGLLGYPHGGYPFVQFRSEHITRGTENVRGTPERAGSRQDAIKLQRDSRGAHTMLSTVPPYTYNSKLSGVEIAFGPLVGVETRNPDDVRFMTMPQFPQASVEMEEAAWNDLAQQFGRPINGQTSELGGTLLKHATSRWLGGWIKVWSMLLELQQAYGDPITTQLVAGGEPKVITKEEIRGRYTVMLAFSVRDLNMDFVIKRITALKEAMALDLNGEGDYTSAFRASIRGIDPALADSILRDPSVVTRSQIEDQQGRVAKMASGIEPPALEGPSNAKLRYQTLMETINTSPVLGRRFHQPQNPDDELFKALVENEAKNLGFLVEQYSVNPGVGRSGVRPMLGAGSPAGSPNGGGNAAPNGMMNGNNGY